MKAGGDAAIVNEPNERERDVEVPPLQSFDARPAGQTFFDGGRPP